MSVLQPSIQRKSCRKYAGYPDHTTAILSRPHRSDVRILIYRMDTHWASSLAYKDWQAKLRTNKRHKQKIQGKQFFFLPEWSPVISTKIFGDLPSNNWVWMRLSSTKNNNYSYKSITPFLPLLTLSAYLTYPTFLPSFAYLFRPASRILHRIPGPMLNLPISF